MLEFLKSCLFNRVFAKFQYIVYSASTIKITDDSLSLLIDFVRDFVFIFQLVSTLSVASWKCISVTISMYFKGAESPNTKVFVL